MAALAAGPAHAVRHADPAAWIAYERRLRAGLADAGGGTFSASIAQDLMVQCNAARIAAGARVCAWNEELAIAARAHAADLARRNYLEHLAPGGFDPTHRTGLVSRRLIGSASENIAYHRGPTPICAETLMDTWRRSTPHWGNLIDPVHTDAGFGVVVAGERTYGVVLLGRPSGLLGSPVPFRLSDEADLARAVAGASTPLAGFALTDPADGETPPLPVNPRQLAAGVYQLRPRPRDDRSELLWGPIFIRT